MSSILYTPLPPNTIRLLHIEPGDSDTDLQCRLTTVSLDGDTGVYVALSYVWGPTDDTKRITCNGHAARVTSNLHSALLEYRRRGTIGNDLFPLWVDALCINQFDNVERTSQVRMMQLIYMRASAVVVWLGSAPYPGDDNLDLVTLDAIYLPWKMQGGVPLFVEQDVMALDAFFGEKLPDLALDSVAAFLQTPWFHRIWVVQELLSARQIAMWRGNLVIDPDTVLLGALRISSLHNVNIRIQIGTPDQSTRGHISCAGRLAVLHKNIQLGETLTMFALLSYTRNFEATDPRDKLFALVGLASDVEEEFIDYSKDISQLLAELSRRFLSGRLTCSTSQLDILTFISRPNGEGEDMPSWVTDWLLLGVSSLYLPLVGAYPTEAPYVQEDPVLEFHDDKTLYIQGAICSKIAQIVESPPSMAHQVPMGQLLNPETTRGYIAWHEQTQDLVASLGDYPTGELLYEAYWRTLVCNRKKAESTDIPVSDEGYQAWTRLIDGQKKLHYGHDRVARNHKWATRAFYAGSAAVIAGLSWRWPRMGTYKYFIPMAFPLIYQTFRDFNNEVLRISRDMLWKAYLTATTEHQLQQREFEASFSQWCQGRKFCLTESGYIGWAPISAAVGDRFVMFKGYRIPFVLRHVGHGWRIIGDSYVHGWMNGVTYGENVVEETLKII